MAEKQNSLFSWEFDDTRQRGSLWYMVALSIAIGIIIWGFITRQYGLSIVAMLLTWFFYFLDNNSEEHVRVEVTDLWIKIQNSFYDYSRINSYSLVYSWDQAVYLRLILKKRGVWFVNLRIDNSIASEIRSLLQNYIEENPKQEVSLIEKITHLLKL